MHAKAFSNPLFNTQYFNEIVPRALKDRTVVAEARRCVACHAPIVFMNYTGLVSTRAQVRPFETGVTCDFCHTLGGYEENGDYRQVASAKKQGPFQTTGFTTHHSEYSGFVQMGEFCGQCHNATNHIGVEVKSTFDEWRQSSYGRQGFACQECHMNRDGYLKKGAATFDKGQAAYMNIGHVATKQKEHDKLYNHSFPGAHSDAQLNNSLPLDFKVGSRFADAAGRYPLTLLVNNERSGHKMPSGSSDLRFMWLEVTATVADGKAVPVELNQPPPESGVDYSVAGVSPDDAQVLGSDVPPGSRLYRTVLVNAAGRQSLYQYDASAIAFDNRLNATEIRTEKVTLKLPQGYRGKVNVEAKLFYRGAPSSFTRRLGIADFAPVLISSTKKQLILEASRAAQ